VKTVAVGSCAKERPHPAQLTFTDADGHRITPLLTGRHKNKIK
jgi:hypothetical protein